MGSRIQQQLQDQSVQFANNSKYVSYDSTTNELSLSAILNWYGQDWEEKYPEGKYLQWLQELATDSSLKSALEQAIAGQVAVKFFEYDWALNSQAAPDSSGGGGKHGGGFGSGSSPDE